ncbi:unnamed protein product [Adineta ricciae]|uniref:Uncharacterized protein n=1 Tax=Adineta ricciae TaxID=249248 RepID=A0A814VM47_ADIRI|nr:unnamed protein product [Adineta ricciae]CAF1669046.1 unnamed protein product [Adineta ricciae]
MGLSWGGYIAFYYLTHVLLYPVIYVFLVMTIPRHLMLWIGETIFSWKDVRRRQNKHKPQTGESTEMNVNVATNTTVRTNITLTINLTEQTDMTIQNTNSDDTECICEVFWNFFKSLCKKVWFCKSCPSSRCVDCCEWICEKHNLVDDDNFSKHFERQHARTPFNCCGAISSYMKDSASIYMVLCLSIWCAAIAFFEGIVMGYAPVGKDGDCPIPKKGTYDITMDCFVYKNKFDSVPISTTLSIPCNHTFPVQYNGEWSWAACYAWISPNVEVVDAIDALGTCTGITAFIGTAAIIINFLCRYHLWRFIFEIVVVLSLLAIPVLIKYNGHVPFLTYTLFAALIGNIMTVEYHHEFVPLLTICCIAKCCFCRMRTICRKWKIYPAN